MQQLMQPILQHLFQASSLDDISRQRLEAFVEEYPSFGIGHYLLSRKLQAEDSERFAIETQKTNLYFTNPFWLQWQLDHVVLAGGHSERVITAEPAMAMDEPVVLAEQPVVVAEQPVALAEEPVATEEPVFVPANVVTVAEESFALSPGDDLAESFVESSPAELTLEEEQIMTAGEGEAIAGEPVPIVAMEAQNGSSAADRLLRSIEEAKGLRESVHKMNGDFEAETAVAGETLPAEIEEVPVVEVEAPVAVVEAPVVETEAPTAEAETPVVKTEEPIRDEEPPFVLEEAAAVQAEPEPVVEPEPVAETKSEPMHLPEPVVQAVTEPTPAAQPVPEPALVFEPYHTIDYFASQGIKLSLDENPSDQLGKQMKSFTEWLKGMRRLPRKDREVIPDRVAEEAVQTIAAHSIEGKDVLTETMAEVLVKQGMRERARVVYEKLSLLNPEKRAYFAAKIEQLNIR